MFGWLLLTQLILIDICSAQQTKIEKPNIIFIYIDDLGYGDVSCYGATRVKTPNVDYLAKNGLKFTDAHCTAATCTPSRYSLLTGAYGFRNNAAVLPGDAPLLIKPGSGTLPSLLQKAGYTTGAVGKWHLGLGAGTIDWNGTISPGPLEVGFNYAFIIPATTDRVPTVFVENHQVVNLDPADPIEVSYKNQIGNDPIGLNHPQLLKMGADSQHSNTIVNGIGRIGYMKGGNKARWKDEDIADVVTARAKDFINNNKDKPFFLYFATPDIHVPRAPHERFVGATAMGKRGDVIAEMDWMTGQITNQLEALGLTKNTLIIFSSDNGPVLDDGYDDKAVQLVGAHLPAGVYRGGKYSAFEGGTRVPMIAWWPGKIKPGVSQTLFSQIDLLASLAALVGMQLPPDAAPDSENRLPVLLGRSGKDRGYMLEEAYTLALRKNNWKYIAPQEKGTPDWLKNKKIESGLLQVPQLYDLANDPGEQHNLAEQHPELVKELAAEINRIKNGNKTRVDDTTSIYLADPTIFHYQKNYYLYGTGGGARNGFLVYVSKDLKKWKLSDKNNGYALKMGDAFGSTGFWAPQVFFHANKFYMAYVANENIAIAESDSPLGPFTQTKKESLAAPVKQIDPFVFIDDDGKKYLYHVRLTNGNRIFVAQMTDDFSSIKPETLQECISVTESWENTAHATWPVAEGPTVLKHKSLYYLFYTANDFRNPNYAVGYATSSSPLGPWTKYPRNPILNKEMIGVNGTGHGDFFKNGKQLFYVFHTHNSNTQVGRRRTALAKARFVRNNESDIDNFAIDKKDFYFLKK